MHPELFTIPGLNFKVPSYGAMLLIAFLGGTWWMARRARKVKCDPDIMLNLSFIALVFSTLGSRTFYVIHYWKDQFADQPSRIFDFQAGGFEFYGGFIGAFVTCYLYLWIKRLPIRLYADIVTPSLLFGMGVGRIGCFLYGCCFGGPCPESLPWAVHFPFSSPPYARQWEDRQVTLPAELIYIDPSDHARPMPRQILAVDLEKLEGRLEKRIASLENDVQEAQAQGDEEKARRAQGMLDLTRSTTDDLKGHYTRFETTPTDLQREAEAPAFHSSALHPAQLYAATGPLLLAWLTNAYFYRRKRHGMVMVVGFMLYAPQRFIEEAIRIDNPHDTFGLTISQGVSIVIFLIALAWYFILQRMPLRSPRPAIKPPKSAPPEPAPTMTNA